VIEMRDKSRIKRILKEIEKIWDGVPDMRFGQLLINIGIADDSIRVWTNEDKGIEDMLKKFKW